MRESNSISLDTKSRELVDQLRVATESKQDFWSFKGNSKRDQGHGFLQYPAMMVPQLIRTFLNKICEINPHIEQVGDPFAGSGTVITECISKGLSVRATDINPLAVLLCKTKSGPFFPSKMSTKISELQAKITRDGESKVDIDFKGLQKWFRKDVQYALSKIRRAILDDKDLWARRFFWIAMSEAIRFNCNSRTSTFKLHTRKIDDISNRKFEPLETFYRALNRNLTHLKQQETILSRANFLSNGYFTNDVSIKLGDTKECFFDKTSLCDVIITSPPYGDNSTTVPYGQYSFLPLCWIDTSDIDENISPDLTSSIYKIDFLSLGGNRRGLKNVADSLCEKSPSLKKMLTKLKDLPPDRTNRVVSFIRDLDECLAPITDSLKDDGIMLWILGNRNVGGVRLPLDQILIELFSKKQVFVLEELQRNISGKKMAEKNNIANTISKETMLVFKKS